MKTKNTVFSRSFRSDERLLDDLDALVVAASHGDRRAIGAIAIAFGPRLIDEARAVLGPAFEEEAGDVVHDFLLSLLTSEGRSRFAAQRGRALPWMFGIIRAAARRARAERVADWAIDDDTA
jgi:hypothetical protein